MTKVRSEQDSNQSLGPATKHPYSTIQKAWDRKMTNHYKGKV